MLSAKDTIEYFRKDIYSIQQQTDQGIINDKYWLLFPFQWVWDKGFQYSVKENVKAPISEKSMKEITIAYDHQDGIHRTILIKFISIKILSLENGLTLLQVVKIPIYQLLGKVTKNLRDSKSQLPIKTKKETLNFILQILKWISCF